MSYGVEEFLEEVEARNPAQPEFLQAVQEVLESIWPVIERHPRYRSCSILERIVEPRSRLHQRLN